MLEIKQWKAGRDYIPVSLFFRKNLSVFKSYNQIKKYHLPHLKPSILALNAAINLFVINNNKKILNNNEDKRQEANNKQKGCQFKLSLPIDRLFSLNNEKIQGEVSC